MYLIYKNPLFKGEGRLCEADTFMAKIKLLKDAGKNNKLIMVKSNSYLIVAIVTA